MEITYDDFKKVQIKVGTVLDVKVNEKARKPSLIVKVDFGKEIGIKQSSAQITHYYTPENLVGKQVIGVCNFPSKNIADESEIINIALLKKLRILKNKDKKLLKILGTGELKSKNIIECSKVTKSAEEKLQKLGVELKISKAI